MKYEYECAWCHRNHVVTSVNVMMLISIDCPCGHRLTARWFPTATEMEMERKTAPITPEQYDTVARRATQKLAADIYKFLPLEEEDMHEPCTGLHPKHYGY